MANPVTIGSEFQVNSFTTNDQGDASVTGLADGGFVVTWESFDQDIGITDRGVFGQRFNANGTTRGTEFQINTFTPSDQLDASITSMADGGFCVTWTSYLQDGGFDGIYAQRYKADGTANGSEFRVNSTTAGSQQVSDVAVADNGQYLVTWESYNQDTGGNDFGVFGQKFYADGTLWGGEFQINSHAAGDQSSSSVAKTIDDGFVVVWTSTGQDGSLSGIFGQAYNADGTTNGGEFQVNTFTAGNQLEGSVTGLQSGGFIVTWSSYNQDAGGNDLGIFGQRFDADGMRVGTEFQVNTFTPNHQSNSDVMSLADGGYLVTWQSSAQDGSFYGVFGQRYHMDGTKNGTEFRINTTTANDQDLPAIGLLANGNIVIAWDTFNQDTGVNDDAVFAQLYSIDHFTAGNDVVRLPEIGPSGGWKALGGDDIVLGSEGADNIDGGNGSDFLFGGGGDDTITGGDGNDTVQAGTGVDTVNGGMGDDYITAGLGNDTIEGGDGSDYLYGQGGDDIINAGAGAMDVSLGDDGNDTINGEGGMDYMYGYAGNDTLRGGAGDDVAYGGAGNDELYGDDGADWLFGEAGNDKLFGGAGADLLMGGAGTDEITGGSGNDWMWGGDMTGAGDGVKDTFFFAANWGGDVVWDFENGTDRLDVSGAGITSFADLSIGTFGQFSTITSASGDIIYLRGAGDVAIAESSIDASDFIFA